MPTTDKILRLEVWEVRWGVAFCTGAESCARYAELLYDGQPLCIDCADLLLQRHVAISENPALLTSLPPLWEWSPGEAPEKRHYGKAAE